VRSCCPQVALARAIGKKGKRVEDEPSTPPRPASALAQASSFPPQHEVVAMRHDRPSPQEAVPPSPIVRKLDLPPAPRPFQKAVVCALPLSAGVDLQTAASTSAPQHETNQPSLVVPLKQNKDEDVLDLPNLKQNKDEDVLDLPNMILPEFDLEEEWSSLQPLEEWANTPLSALLVDRSPDLG
jgi:hypothetical protein